MDAKEKLPSYKKTIQTHNSASALPSGAHVIEIKGAKIVPNKSGDGTHLAIQFDIKEGSYAGHYEKMYRDDLRPEKRWPNDAVFRLVVPNDDSPYYVWHRWNAFFSDIEDSNDGYTFDGSDLSALRGKEVGGKFCIEETEWKGRIVSHTKLRWTCTADAVRNGNVGKMPADRLLVSSPRAETADNTEANTNGISATNKATSEKET